MLSSTSDSEGGGGRKRCGRDHSVDSINSRGWEDERPDTSESCPKVIIAGKESREVVRLKLVVVFVLVVTTIVVATAVYRNLRRSELAQFQSHFSDDADKIICAVGSTMDNILASLDSSAVSSVSLARATNQTWPFVTLPNFAVRMSKVVPLSRAIVTYLVPLVTHEEREKWESYTVQNYQWVNESIALQREFKHYYGSATAGDVVVDSLKTIHGDFGKIPMNQSDRIYLPTWQNFPVVPGLVATFNWDYLSISWKEAPTACLAKHRAVLTQAYMIPSPGDALAEAETAAWTEYFRSFISPEENDVIEPVSDLLYPIVDNVDQVYVTGSGDYQVSEHTMVGMWTASIQWRSLLRDSLPKNSEGIHVVVENACTGPFTYQINGPKPVYLGVGDLHEPSYDTQGVHVRLDGLTGHESTNEKAIYYTGAHLDRDYCPFTLHVYPSDEMKAAFTTNHPLVFAVVAVVIFAFTSLVFGLYDYKVEQRQQTMLSSATRSSAIVSSLFPSSVCDRLYLVETPKIHRRHSMDLCSPSSNRLRQGSTSSASADHSSVSLDKINPPIAELYRDTTVLFGDIAGFTAWSSQRQPTQVFHLLETVFAAFDAIARERGVFKVETIGDSYVAAVGLPTPRNHHAMVMAMFANDCRHKFRQVTVELETTLGPGTADLAMRFGLNSGPTTGGVLRGEKARFQLFGDTVNTAARMESNGERNRIQVSQKTAQLIIEAGKESWLVQRGEKINCKGKGMMVTYWCDPIYASGPSINSDAALSDAEPISSHFGPEARFERLLDWHIDLFSNILMELVRCRPSIDPYQGLVLSNGDGKENSIGNPGTVGVNNFGSSHMVNECGQNDELLSVEVMVQLRCYIASVACLHRSNAFHNFDHSSLVIMSTKKLLDRVLKFDAVMPHESSKAITFTPHARLALVFSALIHDMDPNTQRINGTDQNSIAVAWNLLMKPKYVDLRNCIFVAEAECADFRQQVINATSAISDLTTMREKHWSACFPTMSNLLGDASQRATTVAGLLVQASVVSHAMQHFTVYKKWNLRLLTEKYDIYQSGHMAENPLDDWYEQELIFFDNLVIPLAHKLKECGAFGASCGELLEFAQDNRMEWCENGRDIVRCHQTKLPVRKSKSLQEKIFVSTCKKRCDTNR